MLDHLQALCLKVRSVIERHLQRCSYCVMYMTCQIVSPASAQKFIQILRSNKQGQFTLSRSSAHCVFFPMHFYSMGST